jgi:gliding motility-associated-like protein
MDDLQMIQKELDSWKGHVSADADLFLYGCSLAETAQGKQMVAVMASLTGMDVNASTNLTGHATKNGDWDLEYSTGSIESPLAFTEEVKNYPHTLQSLTFSDLRTFEEVNEGSSGDGIWTYPDGTGRTAYQSQNTSQPVYLLSAESGYLNEVFKGTITVNAGAGDNDDIGFAFGFNGVNDTYIWSWDMGGIAQGVRSGGAHLLYYKTGPTSFASVPGTLIAQGPNNDPWAHGVTYQIEILYTEDRIKVNVNGVTKFDVTAADAGVAQFPPGKFGFYNYSQGGVTFGNIQNAPASDEPIPPSAQDDSYGMQPNTTLTVNFIDGILKNDYDANLDEFTIVLVSDVSNGNLSLDTNDGSFVYTPTAGYEGTDAFTYKLVQDDNGAESSVQTVTFGIISNNQAPTDIQLTNTSISEGAADNTNIGTLSTTDADIPNDQHDYSLTDNGGGRFTVNGNSLVAANSALLTPGNYTITVRSTDLFGTSFSENFTITVVSNDKPASEDAQVVMDSDANYVFSSTDFSFNDTDGDTFGGIRIETAETAGDLEYEGADVFDGTVVNDISLLNFTSPANSIGDPYATFTFKVFDSRGGISTDAYTMNIEVADQVNPTAIAQNVVVQLDATGNGATTAALVDNGSNDAWGIASLALSKTDFNCSDIPINPNTITLTVTDNNGNIATTTAEVTVTDAINPTVVTQNITVQLDANGTVSITPNQINNISTDNCAIATYALDTTDFTCDDLGENTVILTVTDVNGNSDTATAVVTVADTAVPTVITQDITVQLDANGTVSITPTQINNASTDNCAIATYTLDITDFTCDDVGENTVTLTVTDVNGNSDTTTAVVTVADTIAPTLTPRDVTVQIDENGLVNTTSESFVASSADSCASPSITLDRTDFTCADLGTYTITITATDASGNTTEETATLTITGIDTDEDLIADSCDADDDNDGTPDIDDDFPLDLDEDTDTDGDGTGDNGDAFPNDPNEDTDSDGDGTGDNGDAFPNNPEEDTDTDGDGTGDNGDAFPNDSDEDTDTDGDGNGDNEDAFPNDPNEDTDTDGDGTGDNEDAFPNDPNEDTDTDGDGNGDNEDAFPNDPDEDTDTDGDGTGDNGDAFPNNPDEDTDTDGDGTGDSTDTDDDNDGTPDAEDDFPADENEDTDTDGDGTGDNEDADDDNDGTADEEDDFPMDEDEDTDTDGDGTGDNADYDDDNDDTPDSEDDFPTDENEDTDTDGDGTGNNEDTDDDNDGIPDSEDSDSAKLDTDRDGIPDLLDPDDDNDGIPDSEDSFPLDATPTLIPAEAFTPNGDAINDTWVVPGIDNHPNNIVRVYNRWGHEVFMAGNYQNDWTGRHNAKSTMLPTGSYLYVIDLGNGIAPLQGWIFINY